MSDTLFDLITRAWFRVPSPLIDPVWFTSHFALSRKTSSQDDAEKVPAKKSRRTVAREERAFLTRLRSRYGRNWTEGLPPGGHFEQFLSALEKRWRGSPRFDTEVAPFARFQHEMWTRLASHDAEGTGLMVAWMELWLAHELYILFFAATRYRRQILLHKRGNDCGVVELVRATSRCVEHLYFARTVTDRDGWRSHIPAGRPLVRHVGGRCGRSLPDVVFHVTDGVFDHIAAVWRSLLSRHPHRLDRIGVLIPAWLRRMPPTPTRMLDLWAQGGATLLDLLPNASQAKEAAAELERHLHDVFAAGRMRGSFDWADDIFPDRRRAPREPVSLTIGSALPPAKSAAGEVATDDRQRLAPPDPQYVKTNQVAAFIRVHPKTLLKHVNKPGSEAPTPTKQGAGGESHIWEWNTLRPWLAKEFGLPMPERFPSIRSDGI